GGGAMGVEVDGPEVESGGGEECHPVVVLVIEAESRGARRGGAVHKQRHAVRLPPAAHELVRCNLAMDMQGYLLAGIGGERRDMRRIVVARMNLLRQRGGREHENAGGGRDARERAWLHRNPPWISEKEARAWPCSRQTRPRGPGCPAPPPMQA